MAKHIRGYSYSWDFGSPMTLFIVDLPSTVYMSVYFQACKDHSLVHSSADFLPYSFSVAPATIYTKATILTAHVDIVVRNWVGFEYMAEIGSGMLVCSHLQSVSKFDVQFATTFLLILPMSGSYIDVGNNHRFLENSSRQDLRRH